MQTIPLHTIAVHPLAGEDRIELALADRDPTSADDEYLYDVRYQGISHPMIVERSRSIPIAISNYTFVDPDLQQCEAQKECVFILRGFRFEYARNDFAIQKLAITENQGNIFVDLHDRGGLNQFAVSVDYAIVPAALVVASGVVEGEVQEADRKLIPPGIATLSGFSFEFSDDDARILEIGAVARQPVNPGPNVEAYFGDESRQRWMKYQVVYNIMNAVR